MKKNVKQKYEILQKTPTLMFLTWLTYLFELIEFCGQLLTDRHIRC